MRNCRKLSSLKEGESSIIEKVKINGAMKCRLYELGFTNGTQVECVQRSFSGDPTAYYVKGTVIALRKEISDGIIVV